MLLLSIISMPYSKSPFIFLEGQFSTVFCSFKLFNRKQLHLEINNSTIFVQIVDSK